MKRRHAYAASLVRGLGILTIAIATTTASFISHAQTAGKALLLSGTNFVRSGGEVAYQVPPLFYNKNFTIEFWFNASGPGVLLSEVDALLPQYWDIAIAEVLPDGTIVMGLRHWYTLPVFDIPAIQVGKISFGSWNHLAILYDETNETLSAYLNAAFAGSSKGARELPANGANYAFGRGGPKNLGGGNWFTGQIDEVRFWQTVRTDAQIAAYWKRILTSNRFGYPPFGTPPGLVELWHLDIVGYIPHLSPGLNWPASAAIHVPSDIEIPLVPSTAPISTLPIILTRDVEALPGNSVRLSATVTPQYCGIRVYFEWGPTTEFGNITAVKDFPPDTGGDFSVILTNLSGGLHHSRVLGVSLPDGTLVFRDPSEKTFTIVGTTAETSPAIMSGNTPYMRGVSNPNGVETSVFFEWGLSREYGNSTPTNNIGSGNVDVHFTATLPALPPGVYHFRTVALFQGGRANGNDMTFLVFAPTINTTPAIAGADNVVLYGAANPHGLPANVYFEWGPSSDYGNETRRQPLPGITADTAFTDTLVGLPPGTYHYRAILTNTTQRIIGPEQTFTFGCGGLAGQLSGYDYIRPTHSSTDNDFTVEFFFKASAPGILLNEVDTLDPQRWDYALAEIFPGGLLKAAVPGVPSFEVATIELGKWRHFALVYDSNAMLLSAYLDGQPSGSSGGTRTKPWDVGRAAYFCFGRGGQTNLGGGRWLAGAFDEIRIWRRALSHSEIADRFNRIAVPTSSLTAYWHLDHADSYVSPDASWYNNSACYVRGFLGWEFPLVASDASVLVDRGPLISATSVVTTSPTEVQLNGTVYANGVDTTVFFEYSRGNLTYQLSPKALGASYAAVSVSDFIPNLPPGLHEYRLIASNSFGLTQSAVGFFGGLAGAGHAYRFGGGDYLRTTRDQTVYFMDKSITIELWFFPTKGGVLVAETDFTQLYDQPIIEILPTGNVQAHFNGLEPLEVGYVVFNAWNHVALRYDSTTQRMSGFLNGRKSPTQTGSRISPGDAGLATHFAFGRGSAFTLGTGEHFTGNIDEIRVWNIPRSNDDLSAARYNLLVGDESGLVLNWRGNSNPDDLIADTSPNNNAGSNVGAEVIISTAPLVFNVRRITPASIETQFLVKGGSTYRLEQTSDFINWSAMATNTAPPSGFVRLPQPVDPAKRMSIFRVLPVLPQ